MSSRSLVTSVEDKFLFVMKMTTELLEACTSAKGVYEEDLKAAEVALKITQQHEKTTKEQRQNAETEYKEMKEEMIACHKKMKDAGVWIINWPFLY